MNTVAHSLSGKVSENISRIRELYMSYFDRSELSSALRDFPMENQQYQDIRHALSLNNPTIWDLPVLHRGLAGLKDYIRLLRMFVLPRSNQKLGFAFLGSPEFKENADNRIQRRLMLYALPLNVDRLTSLVRELEEILPPIPIVMPSLRSGFPVRSVV